MFLIPLGSAKPVRVAINDGTVSPGPRGWGGSHPVLIGEWFYTIADRKPAEKKDTV